MLSTVGKYSRRDSALGRRQPCGAKWMRWRLQDQVARDFGILSYIHRFIIT